MSKTFDIGISTAYGAAVRGGYAGTYEQFCADLARLADVLEEFLGFSVTIQTLAEGQQATASYENGVLSLGIPKGDTGNGIRSISLLSTVGLVKTYRITYTSGNYFDFPVADGKGIQSTVLNSDYTLTITYTDGTTWTSESIRGQVGATPHLTIGTVKTLPPSKSASATITGTDENPVLNLEIPKGDTGEVSQSEFDDLSDDVDDLSRQLSDVEENQIPELKSALNSISDIANIPVAGVQNVYFEISTKTIIAEEVTVSKIVGRLFRVGFTVDPPVNGTAIINEAGTFVDAGQVASTTVKVPETAKYIVATVWNQNTDASTTSVEAMIASVVITANYGAKDNVARQEIEGISSKFSDIPAENINTFTKTGWNYLDDPLVKELGKYWNGATIGSPVTLSGNPSYNAVMIAADASIYNFTPVRYVHALDSNKNLLQVITTNGTATFDNRTLQASYICLTFFAETFTNAVIYKDGTASFEQYVARGQWVFPDLVTDTGTNDTIYLPSKVYCAVGRTIELYNEQVALNAEKYHVNWACNVGVAYKRKFSVTGANDNIGTHSLTFNLYDDNYKLVASKTASLIISANSIQSTLKILPIGDSLTNGKEWLSEVPTLADSKIEYIGTRRLDNKFSEGRSGATSGWYVANSSYTYADGSVYVGNPNVLGSSNPFWDGSKFSLNHYITQQSSYVGTPNAVQFMLGTNDLKQTATVVANTKTMVDTIHTEYPTMRIFICNAIFHSNQNGYYSTGGEGYIGVMTNWQYELDRYTIALMSALADVFDNAEYNSFVTLVPVATCMDRENDFGQVVIPVNPRLTTVTETIPTQYTHPQSAGYLQMADAMYSAYCGVLT